MRRRLLGGSAAATIGGALAALAGLVALLVLGAAGPARAAAVTVTPAPPVLRAGVGIEAPAVYVPDDSCDGALKPGTARLAGLLTTTYRGTTAGTVRGCGTDGSVSEHYDGRAVDWMTSVRTADGAARANALITWLLATDAAGNAFANARRLGVMYIIWDDKIWGAYRPADGWRAYGSCAAHPEAADDTACHRDHVHLSLSWEGAMGRTSYWTGSVAARDYGPCRVADLTWAPPYAAARATPCASMPAVPVPAGASVLTRQLVASSGALLRAGSVGTPVAAVNQLLSVSGSTWTTTTTARLQAYQAARHLPASGVMDVATWRATTGPAVIAAATPRGAFDLVTPSGAGALVRGWAFDGESDATIGVRVTVDGHPTVVAADTSRPDVARVFAGRSARHGFASVIPTAPGAHRVCVDAVNSGLGHDVALGCRSVTIPTPARA